MKNNFSKVNNNFGFTLIEMLIGIFVFTIIAFGIIALVSGIFTSSNKQNNLLSDQNQARRQSFTIINQLRNAQTSATGAYALDTAGAQNLIFYSDVNNDRLVERVRYYIQNNKLYSGVTKPTGNPLSYNLSNEQVSVMQSDLANGAAPLFYYYDGSYDGSSDSYLTQPVSVTSVRYIKLELRIYNKAGVLGTNFFTVTAGGAIRNLKDNLDQGPEGLNVRWQLTTQVSPSGAGTVAVSPAGPQYPDDALVNINAYPAIGYAFSSWDGDVNDPSSQATTIVMNSDNVVTANVSALPETMSASITGKTGNQNDKRWAIKFNNNNNFLASAVNLYSFTLSQTAGSSCSPSINAPAAFPALLGDISANGNRSYTVRINFSGCASNTRFTARFTFAGNNGAVWGSESITNQAQ